MADSSNPIVHRTGTGNIYWDPGSGIASRIFPIAGLTQSGIWIPYRVSSDGSITVITDTVGGTPYYDDYQGTTTPGVEQTLVDVVIPSSVQRQIYQVVVATRVTGEFFVTAGSEVIGSGRTGPGCVGNIIFTPPRPLDSGVEYKVLFTARVGSPAQDVECYVQATDQASP